MAGGASFRWRCVRGTILGVNSVERLVAIAQGAWAARTVELAPEPPGPREGTAGDGSETLNFVAVGDSLIAGCGVADQSQALTPMLARGVAEKEGKRVSWQTRAQLGATMRRVRYRYLPDLDCRPDILFLCAGSNDVMARRTAAEWKDDLQAALDQAQDLSDRVWLCSAGQTHNSPVLPKTLRKAVAGLVDRQTEVSAAICEERGIPFANVTHVPLPDGFWAEDGFHPSEIGYQTAREYILAAAYEQ